MRSIFLKVGVLFALVMGSLLVATGPASAVSQPAPLAAKAYPNGVIDLFEHSNQQGPIVYRASVTSDCFQGRNKIWGVPWPASIKASSLGTWMPIHMSGCNIVGVQSGSGTRPWYWKCINEYSSTISTFGSSQANGWYNDNTIYVGLGNNPGCPRYYP